MTLHIPYESDGFTKSVTNGAGNLAVTWDELLWAAITVGRPGRQDVFAHGSASVYEAIFRWSLVRMALEQTSLYGRRLRRTEALRTLDPSEKGAVSYFLGLAVAKLFADKLLHAPWLLHLDVYRPQLNAVLKGRSRPDLIGQTTFGDWVALECKGRISPPNNVAKDKAKQQAQRVLSVHGNVPTYAIGAVTYFAGDTLSFFWRDPEPDLKVKNPIEIETDEAVWRHYYRPALNLIRASPQSRQTREGFARIEHADVEVGIHPEVLRALDAEQWAEAKTIANGLNDRDDYRSDGIAVIAGKSWSERFAEPDMERRS